MPLAVKGLNLSPSAGSWGRAALSAFAERNQNVRESILNSAGPYLPVIVIGEYRFGLLSSRERDKRLDWLAELTRQWKVLEITKETTVYYAELRRQLKDAATPIPSNDTWIASLARQHGLAILSNDPHFDLIDSIERVFDPLFTSSSDGLKIERNRARPLNFSRSAGNYRRAWLRLHGGCWSNWALKPSCPAARHWLQTPATRGWNRFSN